MSEPINILLVDDEARNLDALEAILEQPDYRLLRAQNPQQALRQLRGHDVAAIVLDVLMPEMSGFELAQLIKSTKRFREVPVLFLSAHLQDERDVLIGYDTGAVDYLVKPANPAILRRKIAIFVDLFRKTRALAELNESLEQRVQERTAALAASEDALRTVNQQKDIFLATLAHELRNPLAPLRTGLNLLQQPEQSSDHTAHFMAVMNRQLDHLVRLVDDLLDVSRVTHGSLQLRRATAELRSVLDQAVDLMRPTLSERGQSVAVAGEASLLAWVDAARLTQVLGNLLSNASRHSPRGATLRLSLSCAGDQAVFAVEDPGVGIASDQLERIFDMFAKGGDPKPGASEGLGVGLALARHVATLHDGTLSAASPGAGLGAIFELTIPIGEVTPGMRGSSLPQPRRAVADRLRIVVVEDNADSAEMLIAWLERLGHEVRSARTGLSAVNLVKEIEPQIVLCDLGLPDIDGTEVCRRLLAEMAAPPRMIALTGWGAAQDRKRTREAGFSHHLVKPVAMEDLRRLMDELQQHAVAH